MSQQMLLVVAGEEQSRQRSVRRDEASAPVCISCCKATHRNTQRIHQQRL